jgi:hypothetical protein
MMCSLTQSEGMRLCDHFPWHRNWPIGMRVTALSILASPFEEAVKILAFESEAAAITELRGRDRALARPPWDCLLAHAEVGHLRCVRPPGERGQRR